ncbi:MAG: hypothetical protein ABIP93_20730 [Gemmatimonadaceae bacterium]
MHRSSRKVAVVSALAMILLPSAARAQGVRRDNSPFGGKPAPIVPVSLARAVIEAPDKDMALTDSQRVQLTLIQRHLDSVNAPMLARLDSLKPTWRPAGGLSDLSQEQRDELVAKRRAQIAIVDSLTPNFVKSRERVMALLRPEQQDRANKVEKNARKRAEEVAKRELEQMDNVGMQRGRRGEIRDGTGRAPLG